MQMKKSKRKVEIIKNIRVEVEIKENESGVNRDKVEVGQIARKVLVPSNSQKQGFKLFKNLKSVPATINPNFLNSIQTTPNTSKGNNNRIKYRKILI